MADRLYGLRFLPKLAWLLVGLLLLAALTVLAGGRGGPGQQFGRLAALSQAIPQQAAAASGGQAEAFEALRESREELAERLEAIQQGGALSIPGTPAPPLEQLAESLQPVLAEADEVIAVRDVVLAGHTAAAEVRRLVPELLSRAATLAGAVEAGQRTAVLRVLERFELAGQRIMQDTAALTEGVGDLAAAAQRLADDELYLGQVIRGLAGEESGLGLPTLGSEASAEFGAVKTLYEEVSDQIRSLISSADGLISAHRNARDLAEQAASRYAALAPAVVPAAWYSSPYLPAGLIGFALLVLLVMIGIYSLTANIRKAAEESTRQNERNQQAILRLLDELGSLADGDLTVQATVTEDITGAIADSINYAIEALRELVTTINDTAIMVDAAAKQTQATASHLAKASVTQSKQVASATESISHMANSIEEVSGNAERASDVARHSVDVAHKGGEAVRRTIDGMNTIRETIQDTSKRIKRLGESSQEIGNIVELINDIAEQTNILALNASIQASMAGEAGRGFAVVADEVQRLAERSASATKQIEVLVRTIQSDTNEAVVSMERSTTDVVGGALLAENAGAALDEIEQVSNQIAMLVQNISGSARKLTSASSNISRNMGVLREISSQTADNTGATSTAISKLAELATQLRQSVTGFTLPESGGIAVPDARAASTKQQNSATKPGLDKQAPGKLPEQVAGGGRA